MRSSPRRRPTRVASCSSLRVPCLNFCSLICSPCTKRAGVCRCACLWAWRWCVSSLAPVRCSGGVSPTSSALSALWRAQGLWWGMSYPGVCMWMRFASSWCLSFLLYIVSSALVLSGALMNRNKKERKTTRPCSDRCDCCRQPLFYAIPPFASHPLRRRRESPPLVPPRTVEQPPRVVGPPRKRGRRPPALPVIVGEANPRGPPPPPPSPPPQSVARTRPRRPRTG